MQSKIPIPTDNIYKFYALFGLVVFISGFAATIYVSQTTNNLLFEIIPKIEAMKSIPEIAKVQEAELMLLERKQEIALSDKKFYLKSISLIIAIGMCLMFFGFHRWHTKIQPLQDQILELTVKKLRKELNTSNHSVARNSGINKDTT
ncbi:hypothetical protein WN093_04595 [Gammaproteobacteria bacterium AS21]